MLAGDLPAERTGAGGNARQHHRDRGGCIMIVEQSKQIIEEVGKAFGTLRN